MQIFKKIEALKAFLSQKKAEGLTVGLVPTMGALHAGHISLVARCKAENQVAVSTIYVNPTQFNNPTDLEKYPRSIESDIAKLEKAGCDALFYPDNPEMYTQTSLVRFDFGPLDKVLEGASRPGHFSGVALVVSKLFNIVGPRMAYFGQKDYQQFLVISRLVEELKFGVELRCMPTLREPDGLAMSSRNLRLQGEERPRAAILYQSLTFAKDALRQGISLQEVKKGVAKMWNAQHGVKLDYFEIADSKNLNFLDNVKETDSTIMLIAGYVGEIRLIDNLMLDQSHAN